MLLFHSENLTVYPLISSLKARFCLNKGRNELDVMETTLFTAIGKVIKHLDKQKAQMAPSHIDNIT